MVYWLVVREMFETGTGKSIIDGDDSSIAKVKYLHPDLLDPGTLRGYNQALSEGHTSRAIQNGYPVDPETVPKKVCWRSGTRKVPDVIICYGSLIISARVRDIIEAFEPGVHQLLPVDLYRPKAVKEKDAPFVRHYWLVATQRIDSVDPVHTTYDQMGGIAANGIRWRGPWPLDRDPSKKVVYSRAAVAGRHMWVDPFVRGALHISDVLGEALHAAHLTGLKLTQVEEI